MKNFSKKILFLVVYLLLAFLISDLLLCMIAGGMYLFCISEDCMRILILISYGCSAGVAGFFAGKKEEKNRWLYGAIEGFAYFLIVLVISFIFADGMNGIMGILTALIITVFCGISGSLIPSRKKK